MDKKDGGGYAFPHDKYMKNGDGAWSTYASGGMTKREYFAGLVLQGILANEGTPPLNGMTGIVGVEQDAGNVALQAVLYADALIERLAE